MSKSKPMPKGKAFRGMESPAEEAAEAKAEKRAPKRNTRKVSR
jgi:hypothetical protein